MFGLFKKKSCSLCDGAPPQPVINVGTKFGYLCVDHMISEYEKAFLAHQGRKIIFPPTPAGKYVSYQNDTIADLESYGSAADELEQLSNLFRQLNPGECYVLQSHYTQGIFLDIKSLITGTRTKVSNKQAISIIKPRLKDYMIGSGVSFVTHSNDDICLYSFEA